jgi:hypothetical protein
MRGLIAWCVLAVTALSLLWTTIKSRRILRGALGRKLRKGEETSLASWMQASDASIEQVTEEFRRNPFERFLDVVAAVGLWRREIGSPNERKAIK